MLDLLLAAHAVSSKPLVVHFYGQQCPGCKAMHPKLQQIMRNNGDFTFAVVRVDAAARLRTGSVHCCACDSGDPPARATVTRLS